MAENEEGEGPELEVGPLSIYTQLRVGVKICLLLLYERQVNVQYILLVN